ncbi:MAG: NAD-binding protein, partial [Nannocystaceae bacterium]
MSRSSRRIFLLLIALPLLLIAVALIYSEMMGRLEGIDRDFWSSLQWATETFTSTGYGNDSRWSNPAMVLFVIFVQLLGVSTVFLVFPFYLVPFFEDRFEGRLPARPPRRLRDYVFIYRWGAAVVALVEELRATGVSVLVFEEDEAVARRIRDRGIPVIYGAIDEGDPSPDVLLSARAIIANGADHENGTLILSARQQGFSRRVLALARDPFHRGPMLSAGAEVVYTPTHILAAALAARASVHIEPLVSGLTDADGIHTMEARVLPPISDAALTVGDLDREAGLQVLSIWRRGKFLPTPAATDRLQTRDLLTVARPASSALPAEDSLTSLRLATTRQDGPIVIGGFGDVGEKVAQLLRDAGEQVCVIDKNPREGVDVGDLLDSDVLRAANVASAKAIVIALSSDASTTFATSVIRSITPHAPLICRLNRQQNTERIGLAGSDFTMSLAAVAARLLRHHLVQQEVPSSTDALNVLR